VDLPGNGHRAFLQQRSQPKGHGRGQIGMRAQFQPQIVYSFFCREATGTEGGMQKALDLAHKIEKHGNTKCE